MDLEKVTAKIRPRRGWEAIDLGISLVQTHSAILYKIWFMVSLPIFILLSAVLYSSPTIMVLVLWWIKPILERPLLHYLSRELFGEHLTAKQCVKDFYSVAKIQWFASLTWRRFSFTRSFDLPLIQLEKLKHLARAKRIRVIHSGDSGSAVWLTIIFSMVEILLYTSTIILMYLLIPDVYTSELNVWKWLTADSELNSVAFIFNVITYLAISLVAPFYVACGFALYLNQRTHLEAWDIELAFKRLAEKLTKKSSNIKVRLANYAAIGLLVLMSSSLYVKPISAEEHQESVIIEKVEFDHEQAKIIIKDIKEGEDFHQIEKNESNRYIGSSDNEDKEKENSSISPLWFAFAKVFAVVIEFALWIFMFVLVIFLVIKYKHLLVKGLPNKKITRKRPKKLFGLDLNTESLPDKPWLVAQQLVNEQHYREALSLLYRASLIWAIDHTDALIKEGYTELECYQAISKHVNQDVQDYLKQLTHGWRSLAYAHQTPENSVLISLCENWPKVLVSSVQSSSNHSSKNQPSVKSNREATLEN